MPEVTGTPQEHVAALRQEVARYDPDRYPVQYATASFHLGSALIAAEDAVEAITWLRRAAQGFPPTGLPVEHAKALNMLGIAMRDAGHIREAHEAFTEAATVFASLEQPLEAAASQYNDGLALRGLGRLDDAERRLAAALATFLEADVREHATAAARERGAILLELGQLDAAVEALELAIDLARRGGGRVALGAAANVLGIVHLQAQRFDEARRAFEDAAGAHPPSVRPADYAMARSNLALAADRDGDPSLARLAARQALAIPQAAPDVHAQATDVLGRVGDDVNALHEAMDGADEDRWVGMIRSEVPRLLHLRPEERAKHVAAWVSGLLARDDSSARAVAWFDVLLELPPEAMNLLIADLLDTVAERASEERERLRTAMGQAMVQFHVPQWMRLKDTFNRLSADRDPSMTWG